MPDSLANPTDKAPSPEFPGWIRAAGSLWCAQIHRILPQAQIHPGNGSLGTRGVTDAKKGAGRGSAALAAGG